MPLELLSHHPKKPTNKPPLLFLHGMGFGAWCFEEHFLPWFADRGYSSYAMSLRGHGRSPMPKGQKLRWLSVEAYLEDLEEIYNSFETPPILVGHSMGGFIVQRFLARDNFRKGTSSAPPPAVVLLTSTPSDGILDTMLKTLFNFPLFALKAMFTGSARPLLDSPDIFQKTLLSNVSRANTLPLADIKRYSAMTGDESLRTFASMILASSPNRMKDPPPMLVIAAKEDAYISSKKLKNTALYYKCDYLCLENIGHLVMLDTQWEKCAIELENWLDHHLLS